MYICLYGPDSALDEWPTARNPAFWNGCAEAVSETTGCPKRSGESCRSRVLKYLKNEFPTLSKAEEYFEVDYFTEDPVPNVAPVANATSTPRSGQQPDPLVDSLSPLFFSPPHGKTTQARSGLTVGDAIVEVCTLFKKMSLRLKKQLVTYLFRQLIRNVVGDFGFLKFVRRDFLDIALQAMKKLYCSQKNNLVYLLCKCFLPPDDQPCNASDTRLPLDRMPFGLLDYNIHFFAAESTVHLETEPHYARWLESMYAHFGHKWLCLFRGPTWQYEEEDHHQVQQREVDVLEMALQVSDISLSVDSEDVEDVEGCVMEGGVGEESCGQKRKIGEETANPATVHGASTTRRANVSTLWSRLDHDDITEINEAAEDPKAVQEGAGVAPQQVWQKQNSGIYNPLKVTIYKQFIY